MNNNKKGKYVLKQRLSRRQHIQLSTAYLRTTPAEVLDPATNIERLMSGPLQDSSESNYWYIDKSELSSSYTKRL